MKQAWECPRCEQMNAPFSSFCSCKPNEKNLIANKNVMDAYNYIIRTKIKELNDIVEKQANFGEKNCS